jgi:hypothetical protein
MRAKLRMLIRSWRVWVIVACLTYILGIHGRGPAIVTVWPRGLWCAFGLFVIALLVLGWFFAKYLVAPGLMYLQGAKLDERTAKAKEKLADSLMSFSTAVLSAVWISVLVFPLTGFIQATARGIDPLEVMVSWWPPVWWSWRHTAVFLILFWVPFSVSLVFRRKALDMYDDLSPAALAGAPTTQGTHAQSTTLDPGPPVYIRANRGARHRRRPRAK